MGRSLLTDLLRIYERQFGKKPIVPELIESAPEDNDISIEDAEERNTVTTLGSSLIADYRGQEIWLPIKFFELDTEIFGVDELLIPYATIKISAKKSLIKTPMVERQGSVIEQYSVDDFDISIKGFVIGYDDSGFYPIWPEKEIQILKDLFMLNTAIKLDNALTNIFIGEDARVVIESIDFPEVEGGRKNYRPFSMKLQSDTIFSLEVE